MRKKVILILCVIVAVALGSVFFIWKYNSTDKLYDKLYSEVLQENTMLDIEHVDLSQEELGEADPLDIEAEVKTYSETNIANLILQKSEITVLKKGINKCTCRVVSPDYYQMLLNFAKDKELTLDNASEMAVMLRAYLISCLETGDFPVKSYEIVLPIKKGEPIFSDEYYNAVYGGALDTFMVLADQYDKEGK